MFGAHLKVVAHRLRTNTCSFLETITQSFLKSLCFKKRMQFKKNLLIDQLEDRS